jgi:hypothetical protein
MVTGEDCELLSIMVKGSPFAVRIPAQKTQACQVPPWKVQIVEESLPTVPKEFVHGLAGLGLALGLNLDVVLSIFMRSSKHPVETHVTSQCVLLINFIAVPYTIYKTDIVA